MLYKHPLKFGDIKGVLHDRTSPPRIVIKVNDASLFPTGYMRLIEKHIRNVFDLRGVPLDLTVTGAPKKKK